MRSVRLPSFALAVLAIALAATAASAARPITIQERVLRSGDYGGLVPEGSVQELITHAQEWSTESSVPLAHVRKAGFVQGIWEELTSSSRHWSGLSAVAEFRKRGSAHAEIANDVALTGKFARDRDGSIARFPVHGIPGAEGVKEVVPGAIGYNVEFSDGPFWYLVSIAYGAGSKQAKPADAIAAARIVYGRVHGHPAG